jgi:hypothetical protein
MTPPDNCCHPVLQILPRCINSCMVGTQKTLTGTARPPQPYVSILLGRQRVGYTLVSERRFDPTVSASIHDSV